MEIKSQEIFTWASALSAAGLVLAVDGARRLDTPGGIAETAAGRLLDLADGHVARATGQVTEFGGKIDAISDKFASLAIVVSEWRKDIAPKPALVAIVAQNVVSSVATIIAIKKQPGHALAPSREGKYAMAGQNLALGSYALAKSQQESLPRTSRVVRHIGHAATVVGVSYGIVATGGYIQRIFAADSPPTHVVDTPRTASYFWQMTS